ncbi:MAG: transporter [Burkholderiaceae bacterium]
MKKTGQSASTCRRLAAIAGAVVFAMPPAATAGEGGVTHVIPGAMATLIDNSPSAPGMLVKPMYMHYNGSVSAQIPTAVGLAGNVEATSNTFAVIGGYTFGEKVLGASYTVIAALPYTSLDISGDVTAPNGAKVRRGNKVSGFGDITVIPAMLAWKEPESHWQFNFVLPIYAPTGSYELGRLGNTGLNYWTVDPIFGVVYSNPKSGFNALLHSGLAFNSENPDTNYKSGNLLHFDGAVQQILPVGSGLMTLGLEAFYFTQVSCDSGAGATLGCFKGKTAGLGPAIGYIQPLSKTESLVVELKWLTETTTEKRLEGDYLWLKAVYKF